MIIFFKIYHVFLKVILRRIESQFFYHSLNLCNKGRDNNLSLLALKIVIIPIKINHNKKN